MEKQSSEVKQKVIDQPDVGVEMKFNVESAPLSPEIKTVAIDLFSLGVESEYLDAAANVLAVVLKKNNGEFGQAGALGLMEKGAEATFEAISGTDAADSIQPGSVFSFAAVDALLNALRLFVGLQNGCFVNKRGIAIFFGSLPRDFPSPSFNNPRVVTVTYMANGPLIRVHYIPLGKPRYGKGTAIQDVLDQIIASNNAEK